MAQSFALITDLKSRPDLRRPTLELIQETFPKGSPVQRSLRPEAEFALMLDESNAERTVVVCDEAADKNKLPTHPVVASASYRIFDFKIPGSKTTLKIAGVGLVVTNSQFQRRGLGHQVQSAVEDRAKKEGALLSVLWSDLVTFYTGLGYLIGGTELQWQLDRDDLELLGRRLNTESPVLNDFDCRPLQSFESTLPLYQKLQLGPERSFKTYDRLMRLPNTHCLGAYSKKTGSLEAYGFMGKARDLRDTLHELVGNPKAVPSLLAAFLPKCESGMRIYHPALSPLEPELTHWLGSTNKNGMAFFKVLEPMGFVTWLNQAGLLPSGVQIVADNKGFRLANKAVSFFESQDFGHLIQLFLGPWNIQEMEELPSGVLSHLSGLKDPLRLYFWGFDSV